MKPALTYQDWLRQPGNVRMQAPRLTYKEYVGLRMGRAMPDADRERLAQVYLDNPSVGTEVVWQRYHENKKAPLTK